MDARERPDWLMLATHRSWLFDQALALLQFFRRSIDDEGHFVELDDDGRPADAGQQPRAEHLLTVARAVHSYALGELLGVPGCASFVDRGLDAITVRHHDAAAGGYHDAGREAPGPKTAYNHAFVLLAASSASLAGHAHATPILHDVLAVIDEHFWSEDEGAVRESFGAWDAPEPYRGANSNMHMCEALLAASAATGESALAVRAARIAERLIHREARGHDWMLREHYDEQWRAQPGYNRDRPADPFRPYGVTPGHLFEWSRLCCCAFIATDRSSAWLLDAARGLFARAVAIGWDDAHGGIAYTTDYDGTPIVADHFWWPVTEAIGASATLATLTDGGEYHEWYARLWEFAATHLIDHERGGWYAQLDAENNRTVGTWSGKPDIYHALQACIIPTISPGPSIAASLLAVPRLAGTDLLGVR